MADDVRIDVEPGPEDPHGDWRHHGRGSSSRRLARGSAPQTTLVALVALVGLLAGGMLVLFGDDQDDVEPGPDPEQPASPEPPRTVWAEATTRLGEARSFAYRGTVHANAPSPMRPGAWLAEDVTVDGAVLLPQSITREVAVDARGRAVETVTSGPTAWSRTAPSRNGLASARWQQMRAADAMQLGWLARTDQSTPSRLGVALVSDALRAADNRRMDPPNGGSRRVLHATVPTHADALPEAAELSLALGKDGDIEEVTLATAPSDEEPLVVDLTIDRIGQDGLVAPRDVAEPARRTVSTDVLAAAGLEPLELGRLRAGWALVDAQVWDGSAAPPGAPPSCPRLDLQYHELGAVPGGHMSLSVTSQDCHADKFGRSDWGEPFRVGSFVGTAYEDSTRTSGWVSNGETSVGFETDLPAADAEQMLATLIPFDPARTP